MMMPEQVVFDFNSPNRKGLSAILYGKGVLFSATGLLVLLIVLIGFSASPWEMKLPNVLMKSFFLLGAAYCIALYWRAIISVSFRDGELLLRTWTREKRFSIHDVGFVKTTYYHSWGIAAIRVRGKNKSGFYVLWAPTFDKDRYDLYVSMKNYIDSEINKNR